MAPPPRVVIVTHWYPSESAPGLGVFVREHARCLATVADVTVVYPDPHRRPERGPWESHRSVEDGLNVVRLAVHRGSRPLANGALTTLALRAALRGRGTIDVLHAHVFLAGMYTLAARPRGVPVVITEHSSGVAEGRLSPLEARVAALAYRRADLVCPVSGNLAAATRALAPMARVTVVPNAVDMTTFEPRRGPRRPGPPRLLTVGGLTPVKQHAVLLDAVTQLREGGTDLELTVAGDGPLRTELERRAGGHATFAGRLDRAAVADAMRDADLFVLPSRWENNPVVLIEAMATGLPVVATRVGGVPEMVPPEMGILVAPSDPSALAAGIAEALRRPRVDAEAVHRSMAGRYGFAALAERWLGLYAGLAPGRVAGP